MFQDQGLLKHGRSGCVAAHGAARPARTFSFFRSASAYCAIATVLGGAFPAMAQTASSSVGLEEIIITAQKKEESLQRTPIAVSVMDGDFLADNHIVEFTDIGSRIAGFSLSQFSRTQTTVALRGAGSVEDSAGADPAVGVFIDDVYMGNPSTFDFDLFDLERVEVLRGPQGTIFGKNVLGGAINFITRNPTQETSVRAEVTYGRFDRFDARASVSGPLIDDKLFGLVSFSSKNSDGYTYNEFTGNRLDQEDQTSGRAKLRWTPTDRLEVLVGADYSRDKSYGISRVYRGPTPPTVGSIATDIRRVNHNLDGGYDRTMWGVNGRVSYAVGEGEIVSLTSYRDSSHNTTADADAIPFATAEFLDTRAEVEQFTQEIRFVNKIGDFSYIAGLYYYFQDYYRVEDVRLQGAPGSFLDLVTGGGAFPETLGQRIRTESYAGFLQGTYAISDKLRVTAGARYTWEKKYGNTLCVVPGLQCGEVYNVAVKEDWAALTPKFTVDADLTDTIFGYATISRGFKSGGFASNFALPSEAAVPFDPEFAWNYEVGLKTRWFDNRLQVNLAAFYVEYTDLQVRFFTGDNRTIVGNAGSSDVKGFEFEMQAAPIEGLDLWANYTYQDAIYNELVLEGVDYAGNKPIGTPKHSVSLGASYEMQLANDAAFRVMGDYTYKSRAYGTPANNPVQALKYDGIVNASISYIFPNQRWEVQLWGKNLTDRDTAIATTAFAPFLIPAADFLSGAESYQSHYAPPLTWGVTLKYTM